MIAQDRLLRVGRIFSREELRCLLLIKKNEAQRLVCCQSQSESLSSSRHWPTTGGRPAWSRDRDVCFVHVILCICVASGACQRIVYQKEGLGRERATVERRRRQVMGGTNKLSGGASDSTVRRFNPVYFIRVCVHISSR